MTTSQRIGKYEVQAQIAKCPRSAVYRGVDSDTKRPVALKVIPRTGLKAAAVPAFHKYAQALARLGHPRIAACIDVVENEKALCLVSDLCEGRPLSALLREGAHPELRNVWDIARQLLEALAFAHTKGAVHRDLKPANLILAPDGSLRVTDFGVSILLASAPESVHYSAPEQFGEGTIGPRTDIYQAGVIIYQLVTGKLPFTGTPAEIEHRVHEERPTDPSSYNNKIAWQLDWVIQKALSKDPAERFGAANEFAEGLRLGLQDTLGRPLDPLPAAWPAGPTAGIAPVSTEAQSPAVTAPTAVIPAQAGESPRPAPANLVQKAQAIAKPALKIAPAASPKPTLLFVDDDERILNAVRALFRQDYEVLTARGGEAALEILKRSPAHVVVSDQRMPGMTGVELLRQVRTMAPNALRLLLTGYTDLAALVGSINDGEIFRFVKKPWDNDELRKAVADAAKIALGLAATAAAMPAKDARGQAPVVNPRSAGSLLVIDPNEGLAKGLERLLAGAATVRQVATPAEAAKVLQGEEIAAIVADMGAGMDGLVALFKQLKAKRPEILSILLADEPDSELGIELINKAQIYRFLPKPVSAKDLRTQVGAALRRYATFKQISTAKRSVEAPAAPPSAIAEGARPAAATAERAIAGRA